MNPPGVVKIHLMLHLETELRQANVYVLFFPHISMPNRSAPFLHDPTIVSVRPCCSEVHESGVPLQTPLW